MTEFRVHENGLVFSSLNEELDLPKLRTTLEQLRDSASEGIVRIDFSAVPRCNSISIVLWYRSVSDLNLKICYVKAPVWLVNQFNILRKVILRNAQVESFYAPFVEVETDKLTLVLLTFGENIEKKKKYDDSDFQSAMGQGTSLEPDFAAEEYLAFIQEL